MSVPEGETEFPQKLINLRFLQALRETFTVPVTMTNIVTAITVRQMKKGNNGAEENISWLLI